jgi:hypothetical protein
MFNVDVNFTKVSHWCFNVYFTESGGASCLPTPCDSPISEEEEEDR